MARANSLLIEDDNLSRAWGRAFLALLQPGIDEIISLQVTIQIQGGELPFESPSIRRALDRELKGKNAFLCETVASTIFPESLWNPQLPREHLFMRYFSALPRLKKFKQNTYGLYFERLIAHGPTKFNQLDFMLNSRLGSEIRKGNNRRSVLQASIMEPERDLTNQPLRGFPCLQQVSFAPFGKDELAINGFYGTQFIFQKAYGNYLGLSHLGRFMAHELGRRLTRISCFTGIAQLGIGKSDVRSLGRKVEVQIGETESMSS